MLLADLPSDALEHITTFLTSSQLGVFLQTAHKFHHLLGKGFALRLAERHALLTRELVRRKVMGTNIGMWTQTPGLQARIGKRAIVLMTKMISSDVEEAAFKETTLKAPYPSPRRVTQAPCTEALAWASEYVAQFSGKMIAAGIKKRVSGNSHMRARLKDALAHLKAVKNGD